MACLCGLVIYTVQSAETPARSRLLLESSTPLPPCTLYAKQRVELPDSKNGRRPVKNVLEAGEDTSTPQTA